MESKNEASLVPKLREIERKWQKKWEEAHIFEADPDPNKQKFYLTVAYPYPNSPQHVGHGRTYGLTDAYARFKRMRGFNVLFPMAFHYTGTPILAMAKRLKEGDPELIEIFTKVFHIPKDELKDLKDPLKMARYFHEEIKSGMKLMGYSIDWRREFTTIDPPYNKFITWQFNKLYEKGLLTKGRHPVGWCPHCNNAVGQHDTRGDVEPEIAETTLIKFKNGIVIPVVTFRPETIFGVTNIWINPNVRYKIVRMGEERWIVSEEAIIKLKFQKFPIEEERIIEGSKLIGKYVVNPVNGQKVPILPAEFVDPDYGTGIVMSVPGHAPYDYLALRDLRNHPEILNKFRMKRDILDSIEPVSIIEVEDFSELPARDAVERLGAKDQMDRKAEEATDLVYSKEYHAGRMKENTGPYAGLLVKEAKDRVRDDLIKQGKAHIFYVIANAPVYCRCGAKIVVNIVTDQWFIDYSNLEWKKLAHESLDSMKIIPKEVRKEFEEAIDWMKEKACARKSGLGTKLPFDPNWIIESLSDSTIYMAYYTISKYINQGIIGADHLDNEVFDYIFLGKGDVGRIAEERGLNKEVLEKIRGEFSYWYPLDSRHSGRDLIWNHLTFFIFNHVAIFPRDLWPKQIVVNGSVTMEGKKMSKSLGNIIPIRKAVDIFGADPIRLSVLGSAELLSDADFSPQVALSTLKKLFRIHDLAKKFRDAKANKEAVDFWDKWILERIRNHIIATTEAMEECRSREAINHSLYLLLNEIEEYLDAKEPNEGLMRMIFGIWTRLLSPFAPHMAEEIWEILGGNNLVSMEKWPEPEKIPSYPEAELSYNIIRNVLEDVRSVMTSGIKGSKVYLYVASGWKYDLFGRIEELKTKHGLDPRRIIPEVMREDEFKSKGNQAVDLIRRFSTGGWPWLPNKEQELKALREAKSYIENRLGIPVLIDDEDSPSSDPKKRAGRAAPGRPAIYIE